MSDIDKDSKDSIAKWLDEWWSNNPVTIEGKNVRVYVEKREAMNMLTDFSASRPASPASPSALRHGGPKRYAAASEQAERLSCGHLKAEWEATMRHMLVGDKMTSFPSPVKGKCRACAREQAIAEPLRALTEFIATHPMRVLCDDYEELIALAAKGHAALSKTRLIDTESSSRQAIADVEQALREAYHQTRICSTDAHAVKILLSAIRPYIQAIADQEIRRNKQ